MSWVYEMLRTVITFILQNLAWVLLFFLVTCLGGRWCWKRPWFQAFISPSKFQQSLLADRSELIEEGARLKTDIKRLQGGNDYLLDELTIKRAVASTLTEKLDLERARTLELQARLDQVEHLFIPDGR